MEDRLDEVWRQYDFEVRNRYRARGAVLLETNQGYKWVRAFDGCYPRLEFESKVLRFLLENGYPNVDYILENKDGHMVSEDSAGNPYVVKNWFRGEECNLRDLECVAKAAKNLAVIHKILESVPAAAMMTDAGSYEESGGAMLQAASIGEGWESDDEGFAPPEESTQAPSKEEPYFENDELIQTFEKHNRELRKVRSYIRNKRSKNEFEICILNSFQEFYGQAERASKELEESNYVNMCQEAKGVGEVSHGNYTYHNVLMTKKGLATTNFEKCHVGLQVFDLYFYFRKAMEKNNWDAGFGKTLLEAYNKERLLTEDEQRIFHILVLYPEKYWKIVNFYYNNKKSWVSQRNIQKLRGIREQQKKKEDFIKILEN